MDGQDQRNSEDKRATGIAPEDVGRRKGEEVRRSQSGVVDEVQPKEGLKKRRRGGGKAVSRWRDGGKRQMEGLLGLEGVQPHSGHCEQGVHS